MIAAIENGEISIFRVVLELMSHDCGYHFLCFNFIIPGCFNSDGITIAQFTPQGFGKRSWVIADHMIGDLEYSSHGTIILFKFHQRHIRIVLVEANHVLGFCPAPGIDRLVIVSDNGEAGAFPN